MNDSSPNQDGMPRWVKGFVIVGVIVVLLVAAMLVFGGGQHGPSRHTTAAGPVAGAIEEGLALPGRSNGNVAREIQGF